MTTGEVYQKHLENKKNVETHNKTKQRDKWGKKVTKAKWHSRSYITAPAPTDAYREGWDRIFGDAEKNTKQTDRKDQGDE